MDTESHTTLCSVVCVHYESAAFQTSWKMRTKRDPTFAVIPHTRQLLACCSNAPMYFGSNFRGGGGGERVGMPLILSMICLGENVAPGPREGSSCTSGIGGHKPSPTVTGRDRWEVDENVNPAVCRTRPSLALFLSDEDNIS